ncbi:MAG: N-acetylmuramoyl-L-alanine amidase [Maritimibacter sp.]
MDVISHPSPNHGPRRDGLCPELIVVHYTAMAHAEAALERLCSPEFEVSAHYLIGQNGAVYQLVDEAARAWHAGVGQWGGRGDINSRSIGIELDNTGATPFAAPQMDALEALIDGIRARWDIASKGVIAHSDFAPARKCDPGHRFDWARLARGGRSVWPNETHATPDTTEFLQEAQRFGYPSEEGLEVILKAFRQRFRPCATGPLCAQDMGMILDLANRYPAG